MAEENGSRDARLNRIERALELFIADHEQFRDDHKKLTIAQVLQKETIDLFLAPSNSGATPNSSNARR